MIAVHGKSRRQFKTSKLRWRVSGGPKRNLGWIPFKARAARFEGGKVRFAGHRFGVWDSYGLDQYQFRAGRFAQDARGRWYFNISVEVPIVQRLPAGTTAVGIDLGLKDVRGTFSWAYDGSRKVRWDAQNYSLAVFASGKQYNTDLNASYNIGARYWAWKLKLTRRKDGQSGSGRTPTRYRECR